MFIDSAVAHANRYRIGDIVDFLPDHYSWLFGLTPNFGVLEASVPGIE
jgi:hypothetical protein